jgi:hypothetical protein
LIRPVGFDLEQASICGMWTIILRAASMLRC